MSFAPIVLFVYARLSHTRLTVEALLKNPGVEVSDLIIFSDAARTTEKQENVNDVRDYLKTITGFRSITIKHRPYNFGLANSIIEGVTEVLKVHECIIVLEDDLVTSPYFLSYMNEALEKYAEDDRVISIHGYVYPISGLPETFFMRGADCWGWATWKNRWATFETDGAKLLDELNHRNLSKRFDFNGAYGFTKMLVDQIEGKNDSWAIRWHASAFLNNKFTLYPRKSLVLNIGNDGSGEHCCVTSVFHSDIERSPINVSTIPVEENEKSFMAFENFFCSLTGIFGRIRSYLGGIVGLLQKFKGVFLDR